MHSDCRKFHLQKSICIAIDIIIERSILSLVAWPRQHWPVLTYWPAYCFVLPRWQKVFLSLQLLMSELMMWQFSLCAFKTHNEIYHIIISLMMPLRLVMAVQKKPLVYRMSPAQQQGELDLSPNSGHPPVMTVPLVAQLLI